MKVLEIIHLRQAGQPCERLVDTVRSSIASESEREEVTFYALGGLDTDLAIHVRYDSASQQPIPSETGYRLSAALQAFGLVEHSVWQELI